MRWLVFEMHENPEVAFGNPVDPLAESIFWDQIKLELKTIGEDKSVDQWKTVSYIFKYVSQIALIFKNFGFKIFNI